MLCPQRRTVLTANWAVSWVTPTLTQPLLSVNRRRKLTPLKGGIGAEF
jgi:hypothetical protein